MSTQRSCLARTPAGPPARFRAPHGARASTIRYGRGVRWRCGGSAGSPIAPPGVGWHAYAMDSGTAVPVRWWQSGLLGIGAGLPMVWAVYTFTAEASDEDLVGGAAPSARKPRGAG